jgi:hypothetical protein
MRTVTRNRTADKLIKTIRNIQGSRVPIGFSLLGGEIVRSTAEVDAT